MSMNNFWKAPAYLPYVQPPLTEDLLLEAESKLGYKLPNELVELLKIQNGGYISFSLGESPHDTIAGIGPYFPSLTDFDFGEVQEYVDFSLEGLVPFDGDGHWYLCLDYRESYSLPAVTFVDIECNEELKISGTFSEYLSLLKLEIGDEKVIEDVANVNDLIQKFSELLECEFLTSGSLAHGYDKYRSALGDESRPEWLWISPNEVPSGFVRETDSRYDELKYLMHGRKMRFDKLPENSYILSCTDGVFEKVAKACTESGLTIKELQGYYM
jgi:SMI1 / KNR4 family (SUKH-1)